jgi:hypothetical protein
VGEPVCRHREERQLRPRANAAVSGRQQQVHLRRLAGSGGLLAPGTQTSDSGGAGGCDDEEGRSPEIETGPPSDGRRETADDRGQRDADRRSIWTIAP